MPANRGPRLFRILLPVSDLRAGRRFYERLLGVPGREVRGGRVYFDCGSVIVGLLDSSGEGAGRGPPPTEAIYFATAAVDEVHRRALALKCLSPELLHGDPDQPMGEVRVRPWGERSFYAEDPFGNPLCFVDGKTLYLGSPAQVRALRRETRRHD